VRLGNSIGFPFTAGLAEFSQFVTASRAAFVIGALSAPSAGGSMSITRRASVKR